MKDDQASACTAGTGSRLPGIGTQAVPLECIPVVTIIDPAQSLVLGDITISGQKFQPTASTCGPVNVPPIVTFLDSHPGGPLVAAVRSFNDTQIVARVPNGAKTGLVAVTNTKGIVSPLPGALTVLPAIESFSPSQGGVGTAVRINGTALYNTPQFFFQGRDGALIPAAFSNPSLTSILVAVPAGAVTGPITVVTKGGGTARTAGNFTVTAALPQVADCMPRFGAPGSKVSLFAQPGTRFEAIRTVRFLTDPDALGRARRIVLGPTEFAVSGDMSRIDVLVPFGAVTGKIRVTNDAGAGASPQLAPGRMQFSAVRDGANLPPQALAITRAATAAAEQTFTISDDAPWLNVQPGIGMTPGTAMVGIDTFGLKAGRYAGLVTVRSDNPPTVITAAVELTVNAPAGAITIVVEADPLVA